MLSIFAFREAAIDVASAAVGVGVAVGVAEGAGLTDTAEEEAADVA
jgi:hypothetical protein